MKNKYKFKIGQRVLKSLHSECVTGTVIARFREDSNKNLKTYVVSLDKSYISPVHTDIVHRAIYGEEFLTSVD